MFVRAEVIESREFQSAADRLLSMDELHRLIDLVSRHPESGQSLGGGLRKLRFGRGSQGKRGGVRVVYFFQRDDMTIFMLAIFAKNEKANLTKMEKAALIRELKRSIA